MIYIASNAFKEVLSSKEANECLQAGLVKSKKISKHEIVSFPMSDGGDGMNAVYSNYKPCKQLRVQVRNPLGKMCESTIAFEEASATILIEGAIVSGLQMIQKRDRSLINSWSFGVGDAIRQTIQLSPKKIIIGMGGSGVADLGIGALTSLGAVVEVKGKKTIIEEGTNLAALQNISNIELNPVIELLGDTELLLLNDVFNPLLGTRGAARSFGPQKGASEQEVNLIERISNQFVDLIGNKFDVDVNVSGVGAAGGLAAGFMCHRHCTLRLGSDFFAELSGIFDNPDGVEALITGEGRFDKTSEYGKLPFFLSKGARKNMDSVKIIGVFGQNTYPEFSARLFDWDYSFSQGNVDVDLENLKLATPNCLQAVGAKISSDLRN